MKNIKNLLAVLLFMAPLIVGVKLAAQTENAGTSQTENIGATQAENTGAAQEEICVRAQEGVETAEQTKNEESATQPGTQLASTPLIEEIADEGDAANGKPIIIPAGVTHLIAACALYKPFKRIVYVAHELGHAFTADTFFPGCVSGIRFWDHCIKRNGIVLECEQNGKIFEKNGKIIECGGRVSYNELLTCANPDAWMPKMNFEIQRGLISLAGPAAGVATTLMLGKLSKHKKCPKMIQWSLRALSCFLVAEQLAQLIPDPDLASDGGKIFTQVFGDGVAAGTRHAVAIGSSALVLAAGAYVVHKEFPGLFKRIKEELDDGFLLD